MIYKPNKENFILKLSQISFLCLSKQSQMNMESYRTFIQSLEKQINSRQQQRVSMQISIQNMDKEIAQHINRNHLLKDENSHLNKTKDLLLTQLKKKQDIINDKNSLLNTNQSSDSELKKKINFFQTQNINLQAELRQKETLLNEKNTKLRDFDSQTRKNASLIEGYKSIVNEKARQLARQQSKVRQLQQQKDLISKQAEKVRSQYELQKQALFQIRQSEGSVHQSARQHQARIVQLQNQVEQLKQLHRNQLQTLQFNHNQQINLMIKQKNSLDKEIVEYGQKIQNLKQVNQQMKRQHETQYSNKDQVVNNLINQINFLKEEKTETQKQQQIKQDQITRQIIKMGLESTVLQNKMKNLHDEIQNLKNSVMSKQAHIQQLRQQIQRVKAQKQGGQASKNIQIQRLLETKFELQQRYLQVKNKLKESKQARLQLEEQIRSLAYQKSSSHSSKAQLSQVVKSHEFTISKLQQLLDQSKKVNAQISKLLFTGTNQMESLEQSNKMFMNQKIQWIKRQEDYRRKIVQYRNHTNLSSKSYRESAIRNTTKRIIEYGKLGRQSQVIGPETANNQILGEIYQRQAVHYVAGGRTKTLNPTNFNRQNNKVFRKYIHAQNSRHSSQSNEDSCPQFPQFSQNQKGSLKQGNKIVKKSDEVLNMQNSSDVSDKIMKKKDNNMQAPFRVDLASLKPNFQYGQDHDNQIEHVYSEQNNGINTLLDKLNKE